MTALFYHLTRGPADALIPQVIGRARAAGWVVEIRGRQAEALDRLDDLLWPEGGGFLPHGRAGGPHDARQPVLLTTEGQPAANNPQCLIALDGAEVSAAEAAALERTCIVFNGADLSAVERAREQWRQLTGAGISAEYWSDADGRWQKKR